MKHTYTYDTYGNVLSHTTSATGLSSLTERFEYDATHRFITKHTATDGIVNTYTYDKLGNCTEIKDITDASSPLTRKYQYDSLGRLVKTISPERVETMYKYSYANNASKAISVTTQTYDHAPITTYYDNCGREVLSETKGIANVSVQTKTTYNVKGLIASQSITEGKLTLSTFNSYDAFGRITRSTHSNGSSTTYSYANHKQQIVQGNHPKITTYDASGNIKTITDGVATASYTYASCGKPTKIVCADATYTMQYDNRGRQTQLSDPNAGTTRYEYDTFGRIVKQTDARGTISTFTYDAHGLLTNKKCGNITTSYIYDNKNILTCVKNADCVKTYTYDKYQRLTSEIVNTLGHELKTSYTYDIYGRPLTTTYPDGTKKNSYYDHSGNLVSETINGTRLWNMVSNDGTSQKTTMPQGTIDTKIDAEGRLQSKTYTTGQENKISFNYTYNKNTGNIISKVIDYGTVRNIENYTYDATDRLLSVTMGGHNMQISYAPNGNILSKTDIGAYTYETTRPHAVASVENKNKTISHETQQITYTPFNKVKSIKEKVNGKYLELNITYGPDNQRVMTELKADNKLQETRLYVGNFEQVIDQNNKTTNLLYITSPEGLTHIVANGTIYYALTDHLGSVVRLYKNNTDLEFATTYDAWGTPTTTTNRTTWLRRGYCQHEHWPEFGLIDMNGRFYDPQLGRFLSPDPYVQDMTNPQNFNRYSYCLNNPLKYSDPSGEMFVIDDIIVAAAFGAIMNVAMQGMSGNINSTGDYFKYLGIGALAGVVGGYVGQAVGGAVGTIGFGGGALTGAASGAAGGFINGASNAWVDGASFSNGLLQGLANGGIGAVAGGVVGGISSGIEAHSHGGNFWSGRGATYESLATEGLSPNNVKVGNDLEYTNSFANDVANSTYGNVEYVSSLQVNAVPHGYSLNNGCIINNKTNSMANGVTEYIGKGKSVVYLGKSAFINLRQLQLTIGHEYIHATQNFMMYKKILTIDERRNGYLMAEIAAHNWECVMGNKNEFGVWTGKLGNWSWRRRPYYNWLLNATF